MDFYATYDLMTRIITQVVILSSIVGNILTFIVFSRSTFRKNSISIYCRALAIFDSFTIYMVIMNFYLIFYKYFIALYSDELCKLIYYILYAFGSIPGWILIAFSVDKVLNLRRVTAGMKRPLVHYLITIGIVLFNLLLYIEIPIYMKLVPVIGSNNVSKLVCDSSDLWFSDVLNIVLIIEGSALPFSIMFVSSLITIKLLRDSRRNVEIVGNVTRHRKSRDRMFAITSLIFNFSFIVLKLPLVICLSIGTSLISNFVLQTATLLFFLNFSISFIIHFASNHLFRRELFILFRIRKPIVNNS